ncbi:MAG: zinc ribbon domain-containing protein [Chloroflexi bacterium]|nr:zinc ribbon domain-containing protein [Chloroflexota bacterium]MCH8194495.1 zinc ribbon domain-containing protein [Chloroflexota bacterium]MCH8283032.1 zinc ribbon domain-containing protein [Chloroflexota bacterium]MCI0769625.1 zinc ribbon domain-containing protein [Chloroflexota bacterium]
MPLYEYHCSTCRDTFEVLRPMGQAPVAEMCAEGHEAKKVLSTFATVGVGVAQEGGIAPSASQGAGGCGKPGGCGCI